MDSVVNELLSRIAHKFDLDVNVLRADVANMRFREVPGNRKNLDIIDPVSGIYRRIIGGWRDQYFEHLRANYKFIRPSDKWW
jgi:hypothetical protein